MSLLFFFFSPRFLCCVFQRHILVLDWHHSCREVVCVAALYSVDFVFQFFFALLSHNTRQVFFPLKNLSFVIVLLFGDSGSFELIQMFKKWEKKKPKISSNEPYKIRVRAVCERLLCKLFKKSNKSGWSWFGPIRRLDWIMDWMIECKPNLLVLSFVWFNIVMNYLFMIDYYHECNINKNLV